jgi:hypothetical protein
MVSFFAVESASKYYALPLKSTTEGAVADFLLHFFEEQHINKNQFDAKQVELKLILRTKDLVFFPHFISPHASD